MNVTSEQLKRYADVICLSQEGKSAGQIANIADIPEWLVMTWIANFCQMDAREAA